MATYYVDGLNGSDANAGTSFATAFATIGKAASVYAAGDEIRLCDTGTYTLTSAVDWTVPGSLTSGPVTITGANSSGVVDGTRPLITTSTAMVNLFSLSTGGSYFQFNHLRLTNTYSIAANRGSGISCSGAAVASHVSINHCLFDGFYTGIAGGGALSHLSMNYCTVMNTYSSGYGVQFTGGNGLIAGCEFLNCAGDALRNSNGSANTAISVVDCLFDSCGVGVNDVETYGAYWFLRGNTFVNNSSDGFQSSSHTNGQPYYGFTNNIFYGNGGYGVNLLGSATLIAVGVQFNSRNFYGNNNTSGPRNGLTAGLDDVTLTANPFISSTDRGLNNTAGGGAAVRAAAYPGAFLSGNTTSYRDGGAVQHQDSGGATGGGANLLGQGTLVIA